MGGRPFERFNQHDRLVSSAHLLRQYLQVVGHTGCGPLCLHNKPPAPPLPHPVGGDSGREPGRPPVSLGPVGIHLLVSTPEHSDDVSSGPEAGALPGQGPPHRAPLGDPAVVPEPTVPGPRDTTPARGLPPTGVMSTNDILTFGRLAVLSLAISRMDLPQATVADLVLAH